MMEHANKYNEPHRTEYRKAVYDFRLPYWDYHRPRGGKVEFPGVILDGKRTSYKYNFCVPLIFTAPTVVVLDEPDNLPRTLERNPLNFHAFDATAGQLNEENEWKKIYSEETGVSRNRTSRHPMPESLDNPDRLNSVVNEIRMDSARLAVRLVTDPEYGNYEIISKSTAARGNVQAPASSPDDPRKTEEQKQLEGKVKPFSGSLEGIHNMYHVYLGGFGSASGHIGYVPVAAFDPIFWFHHK
jgi:tyrosinase